MAKFKRINWKQILSIVLVIAAVAGSVALIGAVSARTTKTIGASAFDVGAIDPVTGKYVKNDKAIYTADAFPCQGLRIEPDFEENLTFDVIYYDEKDQMMDYVGDLTELYEEEFPLPVKARIVIHPEVPEDEKPSEFKISSWEVPGIARKVKITVDREQETFTKVSGNLYVPVTGNNTLITVDDIKNPTVGTATRLSETIAVNGDYDKYRIYFKYSSSLVNEGLVVFGQEGDGASSKAVYYNSKGDLAEGIAAATLPGENVKVNTWYSVTVDVPEKVDFLRVMISSEASDVRIYGIQE